MICIHLKYCLIEFQKLFSVYISEFGFINYTGIHEEIQALKH